MSASLTFALREIHTRLLRCYDKKVKAGLKSTHGRKPFIVRGAVLH